MFLTFLESDVPLTKTYEKLADGTIIKSAYPNVWQVTTHTHDCPDLAEFFKLLKTHAAAGHCLLKGEPSRQLSKESRAGTTDRNATTEFLCLDIDGLAPNGGAASPAEVEAILKELGLGDVSYILQWSGSQNITSTDIRCHVFIMLSKPVSAPMIKQWLIQKNFEVPRLRDSLKLTKTNMSLTWALDITACQSDKLIYVAPPTLINLPPKILGMLRVHHAKRAKQTFDLHDQPINSVAQNRALTDKRILDLREAANLPKRKIQYKQSGSYEVMVKPDECVATEIKHDRGYVYFNLNGGDSWGYWHPEDNPKYIHNFKGEPIYLTKEILPDYFASLVAQPLRTSSSGIQFLAFLDKKTSTYWRGKYDPVNDDLQLHQAKNETQIRHFCAQYGIMQDEFIPEWEIVFDPHDHTRVDVSKKYVNTFQPSSYMKTTAPRTILQCPPQIFRLISHVLAGDIECIEHFMNWCAYIIQFRERTQTAWVFQGTEGTGKGTLLRKVLRPLFGEGQTNQIRAAQLQEKYNPFMRNCLILFVDEIEAKMFASDPVGMANLKSYITEDTVELRDLYTSFQKIPNYTSILMSSNKPEPLPLPPEDRRHNVAPRQDDMYLPTDADLAQLTIELQDFHDYLYHYKVDEVAVRTSIKNDARMTLIGLSQTTIESTATAIKQGNFQMFIEQLPTNPLGMLDFKEQQRIEMYRAVLAAIIDRTNPVSGACVVTRDELHALFNYSSGDMPKTPAKFTKLLGHRQIEIAPVRVSGKTVQGTRVEWQDFPLFAAFRAEHFVDIPSSVAAGVTP
jgi:hypothetical protein